MLKTLVQEGRQAQDVASYCRVLSEVTAYVMQTGPRGGRFYYDKTGNRHYGELGGDRPGAAPAAAPAAPRSRAAFDQAWGSAPRKTYNRTTGGYEGEGFPPDADLRSVGNALWNLLGDKAPDPKEFASMFEAQGIKTDIVSISGGGSSISVGYHVKDQDGTEIGTMQRNFHEDHIGRGPHVHHSYFALNDEAQAGGRAGAMFGKALETYKKIGIKIASVDAAITVGPYAWARFGFQPSSASMRGIESDFKEFLRDSPLRMDPSVADAIVSECGGDIHKLSGTRAQVQQLNPDTGEPEWKTVPVGKDFFLYSQNGGTRSWSGDADLRDPRVVAKWEGQANKGVKAREQAIREGKQNARDGSPRVVASELLSMGDRDLSRLVSYASQGRIGEQRLGNWDAAIDALKKVARDTPDKKGTIDGMLKRLDPFYKRVKARSAYTYEGKQAYRREQERAQAVARNARRPAAPPAAAPAPAQPSAAQAPAAPSPSPAVAKETPAPNETPDQAHARRASQYGTTVAQERRIDRIAQQKKQKELLRRRDVRGQAQAVGRPPPDFIPIRKYEMRQRAMERARIRR